MEKQILTDGIETQKLSEVIDLLDKGLLRVAEPLKWDGK